MHGHIIPMKLFIINVQTGKENVCLKTFLYGANSYVETDKVIMIKVIISQVGFLLF